MPFLDNLKVGAGRAMGCSPRLVAKIPELISWPSWTAGREMICLSTPFSARFRVRFPVNHEKARVSI